MKQKILTTKKIEKYIKKELAKSDYKDMLEKNLHELYYFTDKLGWPGTYIFSDSMGYHSISIGDRGKEYPDKNPINLEGLCYSIYWELATNVVFSTLYEGIGDWRRDAFPKVVDILSSIDEKYGVLGQQKIDEILRNNPYNDDLEV